MAQTIRVKRSAVQSKVPLTTDLSLGELAINTYDGKLFLKKNVTGVESIVEVGSIADGSITSAKIADGTIVDGDISASAAIAVSKLASSTISGVTLGNNLNTLTLNTSGTGLSGSTTYNGSGAATFTVTSNATSANTASAIVARDASGNFSAGTITATLSGTATQVSNSITFNNSGTGAVSGTTFNGAAARTISHNTIGASPLAGSSSLTTTGTVTSGTWSASFGAVSGANLTNLTAGNLSGTIPSAVLGNSSLFVGTTSVALNRASANLALTGISSIALPGATSGTVTLRPAATAGTTTITLPATTGTVVTTGDSGTVTGTMIANTTIAVGKLSATGTANSTTFLRGDNTWSTISTGVTITDDTSTNATRYIVFNSVTSGTVSTENVSSTKLTFNPSTGNLVVGGTVTANSDISLKKNVKTIENALDKTLLLRGVEFDFKDTNEHQIGLIAQEIEEVIPDLVKTNENGIKSVAYQNIVALLIESIKEQQSYISKLEDRISKLEKII